MKWRKKHESQSHNASQSQESQCTKLSKNSLLYFIVFLVIKILNLAFPHNFGVTHLHFARKKLSAPWHCYFHWHVNPSLIINDPFRFCILNAITPISGASFCVIAPFFRRYNGFSDSPYHNSSEYLFKSYLTLLPFPLLTIIFARTNISMQIVVFLIW
jgi:hypothetical protein